MGKREFVISRYDSWKALEKILAKICSRGIRSLEEDELLKLSSLYRTVAADLARANAAEPFGDVTLYLNQLVSRAHCIIYSNQSRPFRGAWKFVTGGFPSVVRKHSRVAIIATLLFLLPSFLGYYWMAVEPESMRAMFPDIKMMVEEMDMANKDEPSNLASGMIDPESMPISSSFIMVNNIRISVLAFASGLTLGLGTIYLLIFNGTMLGGVAYIYFSRNIEYTVYFLAGVMPHAVFELTAIVLSGAAGFIIGGALLMPGNLRRADALRIHGRDAVRIMYGVIIMLVIAALIEGFITPIKYENNQDLVDIIKIAGSAVLAIALIVYFGWVGKKTTD